MERSTVAATAPPARTAVAVCMQPGGLERIGLRLARWTEEWFPDPWVFALTAVAVVSIFGLLTGESPF